jgi:hypothetical protein
MTGAFDYREMALDCLRQADVTDDPVAKKTLLGVAKLYNQTALAIEAARAAPVQTEMPSPPR